MSPQDKAQDKFFQDALGDLEIAPPSQVWNGIEAGLQQQKRRRLIAYWSMAAGVLIGLFALYPILQTDTADTQLAEQTPVQQTESPQEQVQNSVEEKQSPNDPVELANASASKEEDQSSNIESEGTEQEVPVEFANAPKEAASGTFIASASHGAESSTIQESSTAFASTASIEAKSSSHTWLNSMSSLPFDGFQLETDKSQFIDREFSHIQSTDYVRPVWGLKWLAMVSYAPILSNTDFIHYADIPVQQTIVQNNLRNQEVTGNSLNYNYSQQFGAYVGYKLSEQIDLIAGVEYANWTGEMDLYLKNDYQYDVTVPVSAADPKTFDDINKGIDQGSITTTGQVVDYLNGYNGGTGVGMKEGVTGSLLTNNPPTTSYLTGSNSADNQTVTYSERVSFNDTIRTNFTYSYFEIPVMLRGKIGHKRLKAYANGGFSTVFGSRLDMKSIAVSQMDQSTNSSSNRSSFQQWNVLLGAGVHYTLAPRIAISAGPSAKWGLTQNADQQGDRLRSLGLMFNFEYDL